MSLETHARRRAGHVFDVADDFAQIGIVFAEAAEQSLAHLAEDDAAQGNLEIGVVQRREVDRFEIRPQLHVAAAIVALKELGAGVEREVLERQAEVLGTERSQTRLQVQVGRRHSGADADEMVDGGLTGPLRQYGLESVTRRHRRAALAAAREFHRWIGQ